jgi:hypothetical protein
MMGWEGWDDVVCIERFASKIYSQDAKCHITYLFMHDFHVSNLENMEHSLTINMNQ